MKILKTMLDFPIAETWIVGAFQSSACNALGESYQSLTVAEAGQISEAANEYGKIALKSLRGEDADAEFLAWSTKWKGLNPVVLAAWDADVTETKASANTKLTVLSDLAKDPTAYEASKL